MSVVFSWDKNAPTTTTYSRNIPCRHELVRHSESSPASDDAGQRRADRLRLLSPLQPTEWPLVEQGCRSNAGG